MKLLLVILFTALSYGVSAADAVKPADPKVVIAPVPGGLKVIPAKPAKAKLIYCEKTKGAEKLCIPQHKQTCNCAKE